MRVAANECRDDASVVEVHRAFVVAQERGDPQPPCLPAQIEQLKDVVNPELPERTFDSHVRQPPDARAL